MAARSAVPPLSLRPLHLLFVIFFVLHAITTVLIDAQLVLPAAVYPGPLREMLQWHVKSSNDFLIGKSGVNETLRKTPKYEMYWRTGRIYYFLTVKVD